MLKHLILTILCDDKPGIVSDLAGTIGNFNGNWLESRLAQLGGKFAGVVRVAVPEEDLSGLQDALTQLSAHDIQVTLEQLATEAGEEETPSASFTATGPDRKGIVQEISQAFSERGINVETLETECSSMPYSGAPLFEAQGTLNIPAETDLDDLHEQLDIIADKLAVDISLKESAS